MQEQGEEQFNKLLETLESEREIGRKTYIKRGGGFKKVYKKADIKLSEEQGVLSYFEDEDHPMKGAPYHKTVHRVGAIKRLILLALKYGYRYLRKTRTDPHLYCPSVKEIYRVANVLIDRERDEPMKDRWLKLRDIVCEILQNDLAYRYRMQDLAGEIDINKVKLDEGDWYWCKKPNRNKSYNFGGLIPEEEWLEIIEDRKHLRRPKRFSLEVVNKKS